MAWAHGVASSSLAIPKWSRGEVGLSRQPVTLEIAGSNPAGFANDGMAERLGDGLQNHSRPVRIRLPSYCRSGGIGRHKGLKIPRAKTCAGSTPVSGKIMLEEKICF